MLRIFKNKFFTKHIDILIVLLVIILFGIVGFLGSLDKLEYRVYDGLLGMKRSTIQNEDIMLVKIDDPAIERIGTWPWSRDILADVLVTMRELGAKTAVFDIEYLTKGQLGIDPEMLETLPDTFNGSLDSITEMINQLTFSISDGSIPIDYAQEIGQEIISDYINPAYQDLFDSVAGKLVRDNDEYFGKAIKYFGNSWLTINTADLDIKVSDEEKTYLLTEFLDYNVEDRKGLIKKGNEITFRIMENTQKGFSPAIPQLMHNAKGAGFTNVVVDSDGTRRRVELLREEDGSYIAQLAFAPLLNLLQTNTIIRNKHSYTIKDALLPNASEVKDLNIPLDKYGRMLINWIPDSFDTSFKSDSVYFLIDLSNIEKSLFTNLKNLETFKLRDKNGYWLSYYNVVNYLISSYQDLLARQKTLFNKISFEENSDDKFNSYFADRRTFFEEFAEILNSDYLNEINERIKELTTSSNQNEMYEIQVAVTNRFEALKNDYNLYMSHFNELKDKYNNSFCIIGNTGMGTTDLGVTPFFRSYANVGTHANVVNTILSEEFITPLEWYIGYIIASILALFIVFIEQKKRLLYQNLIGGLSTLLFPIVIVVLMCVFRIYMPTIIPSALMISAFLAVTLYRFIGTEKDKNFLRTAFSTYLSADVVNEIVNDPKKLTLGGEEKNITAIFTDIRGFSTISEKVSPSKLVSFLNEYLTLLSDIILSNRGTIDKYEGDAIIGFFGAPISYDYHAWTACLSAIRMKQAEQEFNTKMIAEGIIPMPVYTRIGINTGNMVVGNMGTDKKMNYTMMGNDVNLAARLEGVNKVYHTWILVSESTWLSANSGEYKDKIVARRMDKVRVIGISKPVQLYNIVGIRDELTKEQLESIDLFHKGLDRYLQRDFVNAKKYFDRADELFPETVVCYERDGRSYNQNGPASVFSERCSKNITQGIPPTWDGIVDMVSK